MTIQMKKILITGVSGFLGWNICRLAPSDWKILGTYHAHVIEIPGIRTIKVDLTNFKEIINLFQTFQPEVVIHTAAAAKPNFCQENPILSRKINVDATVNIAGLCSENDIPFLFTSTDLVFDGLNAPYKETDSVCPINLYGEQKVAAEEKVLITYPMAVICRMSLMFGSCGPDSESFIQPMLRAMAEGNELKLFVDEFRTFLGVHSAVSGIINALEKHAAGILHIGGKKRMSRYDFGELTAKTLHLNRASLIPCRQDEIKMAASRPKDVSLSCEKAFSLGFKPLGLNEELKSVR